MMHIIYRCPTCGDTKTINKPGWMTTSEFKKRKHPKDLPCGWRGCTGRAIPEGVSNG